MEIISRLLKFPKIRLIWILNCTFFTRPKALFPSRPTQGHLHLMLAFFFFRHQTTLRFFTPFFSQKDGIYPLVTPKQQHKLIIGRHILPRTKVSLPSWEARRCDGLEGSHGFSLRLWGDVCQVRMAVVYLYFEISVLRIIYMNLFEWFRGNFLEQHIACNCWKLTILSFATTVPLQILCFIVKRWVATVEIWIFKSLKLISGRFRGKFLLIFCNIDMTFFSTIFSYEFTHPNMLVALFRSQPRQLSFKKKKYAIYLSVFFSPWWYRITTLNKSLLESGIINRFLINREELVILLTPSNYNFWGWG